MLSRIFSLCRSGFARSFRPKKIIPTTMDSIQQNNNQAEASQQIPISEFNTKLKQQDRKLKQKLSKLLDSNLKQEEIVKKFIGEQKSQSQTPEELDLIRQEMVLNEITKKMKKTKSKKQSQLPIGSQYEETALGQSEKQDKQARILQKLREHSDQASQIQQLTFQDRLKQKYPQKFIQEAEKLKDSEMKYFNELMSNNYIKEHEGTPNLLNRRLKKGETYAGIQQRDKAQRQKANQLRKEKSLIVKHNEKLALEYKEQRTPKSSQVVEYEDENYYKQKGIKQFEVRELKKNVDKEMMEAGEKDLKQSQQVFTIMMDEYEDAKYDSNTKKQLYDASSFGKIDAKMQNLENRLRNQGIELELEDLKSIKRDLLFNQKKDREEELQFQKYLLKKQKKNQAKQYFKKIHKDRLREDLDYENDYRSRFKDFKYDPLDIEGNFQKLKQVNLQRKSVLLNKDLKQQYHFKKTEKNIGNFIMSCFYENLLAPNQTMYNKIQITSLRFNEKKTVVNIFWKFQNSDMEKNVDETKKMEKNLKSSSGFISGKMTQYLGLRYGPDVRFHYDSLTDQTKEIKASLEESKDQVIEYELRILKEKGHVKTQQDANQTRKKLKAIAEENIRNYHNRDKLLSKNYIKSLKNTKLTPNRKHKSADERFWEHVDKL